MKKDGIVRVVIVGCGDRGMIYGREAHSRKGQFKIVGIAEPDDARRAAAAAAFGAVFAEIMARVCKAPATVFTILSEIALIPGGSLYITMHHLVGGRQGEALQYGLHTLMVALAIALGIVLVTAFTTSFFSKKKRAATGHKH